VKKIGAFLIILVALVTTASCSNVKKDELVNYLNVQLAPLSDEEDDILAAYDKISSGVFSDYAARAVFSDFIIPKSRQLVENLEKIQPSEPELRDIHKILIDSWNLQYGAFTQHMTAIEMQDYSAEYSARDRLVESNELSRKYQAALDEYAKKCDVEISYK
jgi:hypothetical protein